MTRKEGIKQAYETRLNKKLADKDATKLQDTEYNNYLELCDFCNEIAKDKADWLNETIKPLNP